MYNYSFIVFISVGYAVASSSLSVINKWAMLNWPFAACLTALQFTVSALFVFCGARIFKIIECEQLEWRKVKAFSPAVVLFYVSIFCNTKLLQHATVDTFIVFRSITPLLVLPLETFFITKQVTHTTNQNGEANTSSTTTTTTTTSSNAGPSLNTYLSLVFIAVSAICYVLIERGGITLTSYFWGAMYLIAITADMVIVKKVVSSVKLSSWGLVYYNNLLALVLFPIGYLISSEGSNSSNTNIDNISSASAGFREIVARLLHEDNLIPVTISCVFGVAISFFAMACRKELSATSFTVLGVVNKMGTVLINYTVWQYHASPLGVLFLISCIAGGVLYQQSLTKPSPAPPSAPLKSGSLSLSKSGREQSSVPSTDPDNISNNNIKESKNVSV